MTSVLRMPSLPSLLQLRMRDFTIEKSSGQFSREWRRASPCSPCICEGAETSVSKTSKKQSNSRMTWVFGARHGPDRCAAKGLSKRLPAHKRPESTK